MTCPLNAFRTGEAEARLLVHGHSFGWVFTKADEYRDPHMLPNLGALQKNVDLTHELGFVRASFDVRAHADLSLVEEAAKRLK